MDLFDRIVAGKDKLSLVGLGYVGLPIAVAFSKKVNVIGFDINAKKIETYINGKDPTKEVGDEEISGCSVDFTSDETRLREAKFHIVAVPTPVRSDKTPDLSPVIGASEVLGRNLTKGSVVVYESTVYPGVTEDICVPILEKESGLKCGVDFKVGYSPERINPGDKNHRLENIVKIVSGIDRETLDTVANVYGLVIKAGVYRAESIKIAEAAKVIENSQRDINIAFVNELSMIFSKMGIDTKAVLKAAGTKWNFLSFEPGLVGGHCIGVDPYYLTYKADQLGYHSRIILAGRRINDGMGAYVAQELVKRMIHADVKVKDAKVLVLGLTFKGNCPDTRNTKVVDILNELKTYEIRPSVYDPVADKAEAKREYGIDMLDRNELEGFDAVIVAVDHDDFKKYCVEDIMKMYSTADKKRILFDVKGIFDKNEFEKADFIYWRL